ncbi:hypothetical protein KAU19_02585 [Candidatus Parcubacteria bacterium]|nr:hypothetical protein [Candidatus Parcubacteria bacterium]
MGQEKMGTPMPEKLVKGEIQEGIKEREIEKNGENIIPQNESKVFKREFSIINYSTYSKEDLEKIIEFAEKKAEEDREGGSIITSIKIYDPEKGDGDKRDSASGECWVWVKGEGSSGPMTVIDIGYELGIYPEGKDYHKEINDKNKKERQK